MKPFLLFKMISKLFRKGTETMFQVHFQITNTKWLMQVQCFDTDSVIYRTSVSANMYVLAFSRGLTTYVVLKGLNICCSTGRRDKTDRSFSVCDVNECNLSV